MISCDDDGTVKQSEIIEKLKGEWIIGNSYKGFLYGTNTIGYFLWNSRSTGFIFHPVR
ncbi:MAG: hypothetical protein HC906_13180 [Bacteroidales bacterium]|nr:hypothetical protein [Bacteroidales bacterium]